MSKPIRFDRHAKRRMKWRKISEEEVVSVINKPDSSEVSVRGRINLYKRMKQRYLKVTCKESTGEILVISVVDKGDI